MKSEATVSSTFGDRLIDAARANDSLLCVGLDPVRARFPTPLRDEPDVTRAIVSFNAGVIAATSDLVCAYKPNLGFYLAYGAAGVAALEETRRLIPAHIPIILDAKVGDIGSTAEAYATGYFDTWGFDAVTVNPYLGEDSLAPFLTRRERGVIVVCKTSNPGSADLQNLDIGREQRPTAALPHGRGSRRRLGGALAGDPWSGGGRDVPGRARRGPPPLPGRADPAPRHRRAGRRPGGVVARRARQPGSGADRLLLPVSHLCRQ